AGAGREVPPSTGYAGLHSRCTPLHRAERGPPPPQAGEDPDCGIGGFVARLDARDDQALVAVEGGDDIEEGLVADAEGEEVSGGVADIFGVVAGFPQAGADELDLFGDAEMA